MHFAIIDGLGHGIRSTLLTGLAVGAYRYARRNRTPAAGIHAAIDAALAAYYDDNSFATGIIGRDGTAGVVLRRAPVAATARPQGGRQAQL